MAVLKWLEIPAVYHLAKDELYELDEDSFRFLRHCSERDGCASRDTAFIDYCVAEGILSTAHSASRSIPERQAPSPSLRYLELQITDNCNLRCAHCYIGDSHGHELPTERVRQTIAEFEAMQGLRLLITGGEPLLHTGFDEINAFLPNVALRTALFTNGLLLTKERLATLNVDEIQISIDGLEAGHDSIRGKGTHAVAMAALQRAIDAGYDVAVSTMAHRNNLADFESMESLFKRLGVKDWTVDVPCVSGRLVGNSELQLSVREAGPLLGFGYGGGLHASESGFGCGYHLVSVMATGAIAKCSFYAGRPLGWISEGLQTVWARAKPIRLQELSCACDYVDVCRGGCRYRAELLEGRGGRDLYRCMLYGILDDNGDTLQPVKGGSTHDHP